MRRALVIILLVPLGLGCGAQRPDAKESPSEGKQDATTSRIELTIVEGKTYNWKATGTFDYERKVGSFSGETPEFVFGSVEYRFIGRSMYAGFVLGGKKQWLKEMYEPTDATELVIPIGVGPRPDDVLPLLLESSRHTEIKGTDEVRGVKARHYRVRLDTKKLLAKTEQPTGEIDPTIGEVIVEAWIDDEGLPRRIFLPEGEGESGDTTFEFYDYGVEVVVSAPSEKELISEDEFNELMEKECMARKKKGDDVGESCPWISGEGGGGEITTEKVVTEP